MGGRLGGRRNEWNMRKSLNLNTFIIQLLQAVFVLILRFLQLVFGLPSVSRTILDPYTKLRTLLFNTYIALLVIANKHFAFDLLVISLPCTILCPTSVFACPLCINWYSWKLTFLWRWCAGWGHSRHANRCTIRGISENVIQIKVNNNDFLQT